MYVPVCCVSAQMTTPFLHRNPATRVTFRLRSRRFGYGMRRGSGFRTGILHRPLWKRKLTHYLPRGRLLRGSLRVSERGQEFRGIIGIELNVSASRANLGMENRTNGFLKKHGGWISVHPQADIAFAALPVVRNHHPMHDLNASALRAFFGSMHKESALPSALMLLAPSLLLPPTSRAGVTSRHSRVQRVHLRWPFHRYLLLSRVLAVLPGLL